MSDSTGPRRIFRLPLRRSRVLRDVDEELQFHLEMRLEDLRRDGLSEEEARREAGRQFGDLTRVRVECRRIGMRREGEMRFVDMMEAFRQDIGFAFRQLITAPGASVMAVLTLALGIGATTVVFSVVNAVVLEAVPFEDPDEIVVIRELTPQGDYFSTSGPNYLDWADRQRSFAAVGAYTLGDVTLTGAGEAERVSGLRVSHGVLPLLRIAPIQGRHFAPDEDLFGAGGRVVLLAEGYWERRFARDETLVGGSLVLDGIPHTVVGVVPTDRGFPGAELFTPLRPDPSMDRDNHMLQAVGRLSPATTVADARLDMQRIAAELAAEYPEANAGWSAAVTSYRDWRVDERLERVSAFLMLAVGLLLLMACGSVSTMLIARATGRQKEMGLRAALGAGRRRIVGQLVTESAVLGALGGGLGVLLAWLGTPMVRALGPDDMARLGEASIDGRVLGVALAASVLSVFVFGLAPALFATRGRLFDALREGAPSVPGGHKRLRDALVVVQFALAIVVVLGAGLMTRSFAAVQAIDLGFRPEGALQFSVGLPDGQFTTAERTTFLDELTLQISGMPGVEAVGITLSGPFNPLQPANFVAPADDVPDRQDDFVPVSFRPVDAGFFPASGIRLIAGRIFGPEDGPPQSAEAMENGFEMPVILDENLAREMWGTPDAVGQAIVWGDPAGPTMRVVGVVGSIRDESVQAEPRPRLYMPYAAMPWPSPVVLVRSTTDPAGLVPPIRSLVQSLDEDVPMMDVATLSEVTRQAVAWPRFTMQVVSAFGLVAVILAAMGIYGVASFGVQRRRREIGIRIALGADPGRIVGMVLRGAVQLAAAGIALGVVLAFAASGFLRTLLYGIEPDDPLTFMVLPLGLALIAVLASWLPARRATGVDPREALTHE